MGVVRKNNARLPKPAKNFLIFFQKPIDKPVKAWYISIIKRGKTPIQKGTYSMYNYRQHDLSEETARFLEEGDRLITSAEALYKTIEPRYEGEQYEYIQELYDKYFRL